MKKHLAGLLLTLFLFSFAGCGANRADPPPVSIPETAEESVTEITNNSENTPTEPEVTLPATPVEQPSKEAVTEAESPPEETIDPVSSAETEPEVPAKDTAVPPEAESVPQPEQDSASVEVTTPETEPVETESPVESPSLKLPVLMYHHVVSDGTACNDMTVTVSKLAGDLQWLKDHGYETVLPQQLISGEALPEKPVLITFDDGYRSNYDLAYPLFQQYQAKAVISIMVYMQDHNISSFMSWEMCREMADSGLVEIGSHTYQLHNLGERNGNFTPGGINGIQRDPSESNEDFQARVLDDLQLSHDLIETNLGRDVTFFAYPFGIRESDADVLIDELFPVTVVTAKGTADLTGGTKNLTRWTVTMNTKLASILPS